MIVFLVVIGLLIAAVLYGIFFLLFKLIWVLCKKQRNFWPLILAGAATLLVIVGVVWAAASTVNRYVVPFTPIIQAAQTRTEPVYGAQAYTDPRFGFGLTLYDGTVFSDWINLPDNGPSLLVGVDTNVFVTNSMQEDNTPLAAYLLVRAETKNTTGALELTQQFAQQARDTQFNGEIEVDEVTPAYAGPGGTAAVMSGTLYSDSHPGEKLPFIPIQAKNCPLCCSLPKKAPRFTACSACSATRTRRSRPCAVSVLTRKAGSRRRPRLPCPPSRKERRLSHTRPNPSGAFFNSAA